MGIEEKESLLGIEYPIHQVKLSAYYIGKYPVTQGLWKSVMGEDHNPAYYRGDKRPVESVSWHDAQAFIQKLNALSGKTYDLPTEAQWEYAARGGRRSRGYRYAGSNKLKEVGWYYNNSHRETKDVGLKYPNELGLYDMSGKGIKGLPSPVNSLSFCPFHNLAKPELRNILSSDMIWQKLSDKILIAIPNR